jgi:hypothetical protein
LGIYPRGERGWGRNAPRKRSWGSSRGSFFVAGTGMGSYSPGGNSPLPSLVTGQSAAGEGATVDAARNGPAVMAVAGERKQRSIRQPSSRPLLGQRESPLPRREDGAPVSRSSNDSRTRNGRPANHSSCRINSAAGQAAPLAGEPGNASPSP